MPHTKQDFNTMIDSIFSEAENLGLSYIGLKSKELHRRLGDYPNGRAHRMPLCCKCMRDKMIPAVGDRIVEAPPKGNGAKLLIHYVIPRPQSTQHPRSRTLLSKTDQQERT